MKKTKVIITYLICGLGLVLTQTSCEYDNYDEPDSVLSGTVVFEGEPVGVRTNQNAYIELWQDGYELREAIPVYLSQDGTFSALLFKGEYKLVVKDQGPWMPQVSDTTMVRVNGNTTIDVDVTPYFTISEASFQKDGNTITATFEVNKIVESANLSEVTLFVGRSILTDRNTNELAGGADISSVAFGEKTTISVDIPEDLQDEGYLFLRLGVGASESGELYYTQVQKFEI